MHDFVSEAPPEPTFRILGPLQVVGAHGVLRMEATRQRVVLAMLLLEANHIVSTERLVDAVWDESPPSTARSQIQICISAIRRALAEIGQHDVITTRSPGYQLTVHEHDLDHYTFDQLAASAREAASEGHLADAVSGYRKALALWSGQPLAGLESRLVQAAAVQLEERLIGTLEDCIDLELQLGRHHEVVGELLTLVAAHPLREQLRAHLMVALYRSGRQAEALATYRQARDDVAEELGLEPSTELQQLEGAILRGDAELSIPVAASWTKGRPAEHPASPAAPVPQTLPADVTYFTGRTKQLDELTEYLSSTVPPDAETATTRIAAVAGRGGVGKTALAMRLAHLVRDDFPDGQLYAQMHGTEARPLTGGQVLESFLRSFGYAGPAIPHGTEQRAAIYRNHVAGRRVLVVLDDVADESQVLPLLPGTGDCAVIITSRSKLTGLPTAHHLDLDVLSEDQALQMLATLVGPERVNEDQAAALAMVTLCGFLPLAIRICAARLAARTHWPIQRLVSRLSDERRRLDEMVHHGVGMRPSIAIAYASLPAKAQLLFRLLGTLEAPNFGAWVAAPLLDADLFEAEDVLESIVDIRLLDAEELGGVTHYRFHDLVRVYAREQLIQSHAPDERRAALERVLSAWLSLARAAHKRHYGGDYTTLHSEEPGWPLPHEFVAELIAEPLEWFERERHRLVVAVRQSSEIGLDNLCWDLAITTVTLFETRGYHDDWRNTHHLASDATARAGNRRGHAAMQYSLGALNVVEHRLTEAGKYLEEAAAVFAELGDDHGRALALRHLAFIARMTGDLDSAVDKYEDALAGLEATDDRGAQAHVLSGLAQVRLDQKNYDLADELLTRALDIATLSGGTRVLAQLLRRLGEARQLRGDLEGAEGAFRHVLRLATENGDMIGEAYALYGLGCVHLQRNRPKAAGTALHRALALADERCERVLSARVCLALAELDHSAGRLTDATERLETTLALFEDIGAVHWRTRTLVLLGEVSQAAGRMDVAADALGETDRRSGGPAT